MALVRPGNALLVWDNVCLFRGDVGKVSNYKLGTDIFVGVTVNGEPDQLCGTFFAKGANRDAYKGSLQSRADLGEFVIKVGTAHPDGNASLAECKALDDGFDGGIAICFYVELPKQHETASNHGQRVTLLVEPAVLSGKKYFVDMVAAASALPDPREVVVAAWAFAVEVGLFAFQHALHWHMIDFRLENLYVYDGGVGMLDFEHVVPRASTLSRLAGAFIQFLKDATHLLPEEYHQRWEKVHSAVRCVSQTNYCLEERCIQRFFIWFHSLRGKGV